jgi:hypothetical protein
MNSSSSQAGHRLIGLVSKSLRYCLRVDAILVVFLVQSVSAYQAQSQGLQGRDLSTSAPLRALRARTPDRAWA